MADRLRALADENRIRLLLALRDGESPVGRLAGQLGLNQASTSKHLAVLKAAGLVEARRSGTQSLYSVADREVFDMCAIVCRGVIERLKAERDLLASSSLPSRRKPA